MVIQENCILKAARAFLVFKAVEEMGEIIVSEPSAQNVEDEKFDRDFTLIVLTDAELEDLITASESVSEIEKVNGAPIELENIDSRKTEAAAKAEPEEKAAETPAPVANAAAPVSAATAAPAAAAAPADRKSVV